MNEKILKNPDGCYHLAEQKAAYYFKTLYTKVMQKAYIPSLTKDFQEWKHNHIRHFPLISYFARKKASTDYPEYRDYIQWLEYNGKLKPYLERSIAYIYMRDLGKALDAPETQAEIQQAVNNLYKHLTNRSEKSETYSMDGLYRWARKEGVEPAFFWLIDKLKTVSENIPKELDVENAQRKLIKIIAGVVMHELNEMDDGISPDERTRKLDEAVRLGYSYGLTYPFIDDLLDSNVLSDKEKKQFSDLIRSTLVTGTVPKLGQWAGRNAALIRYVHSELREAFEYIKAKQQLKSKKSFFEQAYIFFHSQEVDREKKLTNPNYTNEELYIPIILKSSSSRLITRSVISAPEDEGFESRTFFYGIYNQLADDFTDMFDDMEAGAVTPYTYYMKYRHKRPDLINPFELYWTVVAYLIHDVYHSDPSTLDVILNRAINGLKRYKERLGTQKYNEVMGFFASGKPEFSRLIQKMVRKADDVDFFDKLLRDYIITILKNERKQQEEFLETVKTVRNQINSFLTINKDDYDSQLNDSIIDAANYILEGDGKRLRPIMTWVMGVREYGLHQSAIVPLLRALEYMHTASLIFDDLPSQDNASIRRGRPTLHKKYNMAIAELTGLFLTQRAVEEQTSLDQFDAKRVLQLIRYSARVTEDVCMGQAMDLDSKGKALTLEQLNIMSHYKTGIAFEASLIMPAILAKAGESEMEALKKFARHAGVAFQIKDDLLDVEGNLSVLGKPVGKDVENKNSTFVSILGRDSARKEMWDHYCLALEALRGVPRNTAFLKHLLSYMVNRDH